MAGKGSSFEREVSKQLSLWFSHGESDSWIWRTAMSGGRATVRAKKGQTTSGGAGDLTFTDAKAAPLFELVTFELKRGYAKTSLSDLIDRNDGTKPGTFEQWVAQAYTSSRQGGTEHWMIIHKRNNRPAMAYINSSLYRMLAEDGHSGSITLARPTVTWVGKVRLDQKASSASRPIRIVAMPFDQFLDLVNPESLGAAPCPKKASGNKSSTSSPKPPSKRPRS